MIGSVQPHHTQEPLIFQLRRGQALQAQATQSANNESLLGLFGAILYFLQCLATAQKNDDDGAPNKLCTQTYLGSGIYPQVVKREDDAVNRNHQQYDQRQHRG